MSDDYYMSDPKTIAEQRAAAEEDVQHFMLWDAGFHEVDGDDKCDVCGCVELLLFRQTNAMDAREGEYMCGDCAIEAVWQEQKHGKNNDTGR